MKIERDADNVIGKMEMQYIEIVKKIAIYKKGVSKLQRAKKPLFNYLKSVMPEKYDMEEPKAQEMILKEAEIEDKKEEEKEDERVEDNEQDSDTPQM